MTGDGEAFDQSRNNEIKSQLSFCQVSGLFQIENDMVYSVCLCFGNSRRVWRIYGFLGGALFGCATGFVLFSFWSWFFGIFFRFMLGLDLLICFLPLISTQLAVQQPEMDSQETSRKDGQKDSSWSTVPPPHP